METTPIADPTATEGEATEIPVAPATTQDAAATTKDETVSNGVKEEDPTTIAEMMEDAEAAAAAAAVGTEDAPAPAPEEKEPPASAPAPADDAPTADANEEAKEEAKEETTEEPAGEKAEGSSEKVTPAKETKKRVRRVGRTPTRKIPKLEEKIATPLAEGADTNTAPAATATAGAVDAATAAATGAGPEAVGATPMEIVPQPPASQGVLSKHDEKWLAMFQKLMEFKERNKHTLVPQCYTEDPRLGRWVHYQRVEYWIFQQKGTAKITEERIARLDHIGFEWDPQKAQWEKMFAKLKEFKKEFSHCRVPKGYDKDWELANWVRNQRLEQANLSKEGKKSRMTPERFKLLDDLGFKWSSPTPARARRNKTPTKKADGEEQKAANSNGTAPDIKIENSVPPPTPAETDPAQAEALTAATNVVGNLSAVEGGTNEESFVQDTIEGKPTGEENTKTDAPSELPVESENLATV